MSGEILLRHIRIETAYIFDKNNSHIVFLEYIDRLRNSKDNSLDRWFSLISGANSLNFGDDHARPVILLQPCKNQSGAATKISLSSNLKSPTSFTIKVESQIHQVIPGTQQRKDPEDHASMRQQARHADKMERRTDEQTDRQARKQAQKRTKGQSDEHTHTKSRGT